MSARPTRTRRYGALDREIFALALPTFATLVTEPLLLIADSAFIGHLGTDQLAGLGIAANLIGIVVGLCIFLAYGTTSTVARRLGAGDRRAALAGGSTDWRWPCCSGSVWSSSCSSLLPAIVGAYGPSAPVREAALAYLRVAVCGLPSVLRAAGRHRRAARAAGHHHPAEGRDRHQPGQHRLERPLVYGVGLGIRGSAIGTLIAQTGAAAVIAVIVVRGARRVGVPLGFHPAGISPPPAPGSGWSPGPRPCRPRSP